MRISTRNLMAAGSISAPTAAAGYSSAGLADGVMARPWRSASASSTHTFTVTFAAAQAIDFFAIFDARALTGGPLNKVEAFYMVGGIPVSVGTLKLNERGDGSLSLVAPIAQTTWRFVCTLSSSGLLQIGELWLGHREDVAVVAELAPTEQHYAIVNGDWGRLNEPMRVSYDLTWPPLTDAQSNELHTVLRNVGGAHRTVVIVPDEAEPSRVHLGRLSNSLGFRMPPHRMRLGHSLTFHEGRRPHAP